LKFAGKAGMVATAKFGIGRAEVAVARTAIAGGTAVQYVGEMGGGKGKEVIGKEVIVIHPEIAESIKSFLQKLVESSNEHTAVEGVFNGRKFTIQAGEKVTADDLLQKWRTGITKAEEAHAQFMKSPERQRQITLKREAQTLATEQVMTAMNKIDYKDTKTILIFLEDLIEKSSKINDEEMRIQAGGQLIQGADGGVY